MIKQIENSEVLRSGINAMRQLVASYDYGSLDITDTVISLSIADVLLSIASKIITRDIESMEIGYLVNTIREALLKAEKTLGQSYDDHLKQGGY